MINVTKTQTQELTWLDVEHQIFNEKLKKIFTVRFCGIRIFHRTYEYNSIHEILKEDRKVGFLSDVKKGK